MGLDVSAFSKVENVDDETEIDGTFVRLYLNRSFLERADGLVEGLYSYDKKVEFRAGSYSAYNAFRDLLARFALDAPAEDVWKDPGRFHGRPFYELINFADNEGTIGPRTSAKLARDFRENAGKAFDFAKAIDKTAHFAGIDEYFVETYQLFAEAFDLAADGGAVAFH